MFSKASSDQSVIHARLSLRPNGYVNKFLFLTFSFEPCYRHCKRQPDCFLSSLERKISSKENVRPQFGERSAKSCASSLQPSAIDFPLLLLLLLLFSHASRNSWRCWIWGKVLWSLFTDLKKKKKSKWILWIGPLAVLFPTNSNSG